MGQILSSPITTKKTDLLENETLIVASSSMQGWRLEMEDYHTKFLNMPGDREAAFFAVYDGHGNGYISKHAALRLHDMLTNRPEYSIDIPLAFSKAFIEFDCQVKNRNEWEVCQAGTTANVVLIKNNKLYCANVGDSRAVACINGSAQALSIDHKPDNPSESRRIVDAGGWVEFNRVNGCLNLSRALGDFMYKSNIHKSYDQQMVIPCPEVKTFDLNSSWDFFFMASDGIWDCMSNTALVDYIRLRLNRGKKPKIICEELLDHCLSPNSQLNGGIGCDNMTAILVVFKQQYGAKIKSPASLSRSKLSGFGDSSLKTKA